MFYKVAWPLLIMWIILAAIFVYVAWETYPSDPSSMKVLRTSGTDDYLFLDTNEGRFAFDRRNKIWYNLTEGRFARRPHTLSGMFNSQVALEAARREDESP